MAGWGGLKIEVRPSSCDALSDAQQQLTPAQSADLMADVNKTLPSKRYWERGAQR